MGHTACSTEPTQRMPGTVKESLPLHTLPAALFFTSPYRRKTDCSKWRKCIKTAMLTCVRITLTLARAGIVPSVLCMNLPLSS